MSSPFRFKLMLYPAPKPIDAGLYRYVSGQFYSFHLTPECSSSG